MFEKLLNKDKEDKKKHPRLSIAGSDGAEVTKKFATARVIKWGLIIYLLWSFQSCFNQGALQQKKNQNPPSKPPQTIEQVLPSKVKSYEASKLEFKKAFVWGNSEVYKNGLPLGYLGEANVLISNEGEVAGYLNTSGLYNSLGEHTGSYYKGEIFDLNGNKIGILKSNEKSLEAIVKGDEKLMGVGGTAYVIMAKEPVSKEYRIVGLIDGYKDSSKEVLKQEDYLIHHD